MGRVSFPTQRPSVEHSSQRMQNLAAGSTWYASKSLSKGDTPETCTIVKVERYGNIVYVTYRFNGKKIGPIDAHAFIGQFCPADNLHKSVGPTAAVKSDEQKARDVAAKIRAINWV